MQQLHSQNTVLNNYIANNYIAIHSQKTQDQATCFMKEIVFSSFCVLESLSWRNMTRELGHFLPPNVFQQLLGIVIASFRCNVKWRHRAEMWHHSLCILCRLKDPFLQRNRKKCLKKHWKSIKLTCYW